MATVQLVEKLTHVVHDGTDFSGQDLKGRNLSDSCFKNCNFDHANLVDAVCERSDFTGSTFRKSLMTRASFKNSKLANTVFEPADCYGITFTFDCKTFENMKIGQLWWYCWLVFAASMIPASHPIKGNLKDQLIGIIGAERLIKLRNMFQRRNY